MASPLYAARLISVWVQAAAKQIIVQSSSLCDGAQSGARRSATGATHFFSMIAGHSRARDHLLPAPFPFSARSSPKAPDTAGEIGGRRLYAPFLCNVSTDHPAIEEVSLNTAWSVLV